MAQVSIVLPSYNHANFLEDRLNSIINQTFKDWELIIIDDNSNDGSLKILSQFVRENANKVKHFISNKQNSGSGYNSWKKGIELADSKYIWIAETDDYSAPTFLEEQIKVLEKTNAILSFCTSKYVDFQGNYLYNSTNRTKDLDVKKDDFKLFDGLLFLKKMPFNTYITNGSSVVFKKPQKKIPQELFKFKQSSDIFLWTYLLQHNKFVFLNKELNFFRRHDGSTSTKIAKFKKESVYYEKAVFLNMFKMEFKYKEFIKHYIKHYIWANKKEVFNTKSLKLIKQKPFKVFTYYLEMLLFTTNKIMDKIVK